MAKLLDQYGNPIDTQALKAEIATPALTGVRRVLGSHPTIGLTPQRLAQLLIAAESGHSAGYLELAEEMEEKYPHYQSVLNTRKRAVQGLEIAVEAAGESATEQAHADLLREQVPVIEAALYDIMDAVGKGFSCSEILWDVSSRQWQPRALVWRDPRWFQFDKTDGRTLRLRDAYQPDGIAMPPWKFVRHTVSAKSGIPIRGGIARAAAWSYLFQNYAIKDWVVFAEVFGQPIRLGKYEDSTTSPEQIQILLDALRAIGTDAAAAIPKSMEVDLVTSSGRASADIYQRLAQHMDAGISKLVLGQTLTTETSGSGGGAYALGKVHNDVRYDILHADCKQLTATLNRDLTRALIDLNFGPQKTYPRLVVRFEEPEDLTALADNLTKIVPLGTPVPAKWALDKFGIPEAQKGEALLGAAPTPVAPQPAPHRAAHAAVPPFEKGGLGGISPARDEFDDLADLALFGWQPLMQPLTGPVVAALDAALAADESLEQFAARIPGLLEQMDVAPLAQNLAQASCVARLAGAAEDPAPAPEEKGSGSSFARKIEPDPFSRELLELQVAANRQALQLEVMRAEAERRRLDAEASQAESAAREAQARAQAEELNRQAAAVRLAADEMALKELSGE